MRFSAVGLSVMALIVCTSSALGQDYPSRAIRIVQPFETGGGTDFLARLLAKKLSEAVSQPVVVENRPGAGGTIGNALVAKAAPDGYTLLFSPGSIAVNVTLYPQLPYDTLRELAPISMIANQPNVLAVHPSVPANSVRELLDWIRARPNQVNYGSGGYGSATHLAPELFRYLAKLDIVHVPFKGTGPAMASAISGDVQIVFATVSAVMPHAKAGKLKPLAITTDRRSVLFPELPTLDEAGVPGYEFTTWYGLLTTGGTPHAIVSRLNSEVSRIMTSSEVKEGLGKLGLEPMSSSPEKFAEYMKAEIEKWGKVIRAAGLKPA